MRGLRILSGDEARKREPNLQEEVYAALHAPDGGIVCPFGLTIALAENACDNGVEFRFGTQVNGVKRTETGYRIHTSQGNLQTRFVVNAAGLYADVLHNMVSDRKISIAPRRGSYWLLDKAAGTCVDHTVFQVPGRFGKGVLVTPTVHGNLLVGPTAVDIEDKEDTRTTAEELEEVREKSSRSVRNIPFSRVITSFAGLRAREEEDDFILGEAPGAPGFYDAAGIDSPGLSAAPAIGRFLAGQIARAAKAEEKADFNPNRRGIVKAAALPLRERAELIRNDPAYGTIVCRCEEISEGESGCRHPNSGRQEHGWDQASGAGGHGQMSGGILHAGDDGNPGPGTGHSHGADPEKQRRFPAAGKGDGGMRKYEIVIIGGGPAGLAAALAARENGAGEILILERDSRLGGILNQCIHNGFGLHTFREELTGPEYADRFLQRVLRSGIETRCGSMVIRIDRDRTVTYVNRREGIVQVSARAVILAMGCRERPRGALNIPGYRPAGIYSAGTAQRLVNLEGVCVGKRAVILGSGDIGLIMARRLTLEGTKVLAVAEIMPYSGGLKRNIVQCLDDFGIPLLLSHTVVEILGKKRVEGVVLAQVDENRKPIPQTRQLLECDTLLLSVGLLPENELTEGLGAAMDRVTGGPRVNQRMETEVPGIFACATCCMFTIWWTMSARKRPWPEGRRRCGFSGRKGKKRLADRGMTARRTEPASRRKALLFHSGPGRESVIPSPSIWTLRRRKKA